MEFLQQCHVDNPDRALHRIKLVQDKTRWAPQPTLLLGTDAVLTIPGFKNISNRISERSPKQYHPLAITAKI